MQSQVTDRRWQLLLSYRSALFPTARRLTTSAADAEDLVHDTLVRAAHVPRIVESEIDRLLHTIMRRIAIDWHRRREREGSLSRRCCARSLPFLLKIARASAMKLTPSRRSSINYPHVTALLHGGGEKGPAIARSRRS